MFWHLTGIGLALVAAELWRNHYPKISGNRNHSSYAFA